MSRVSHNYIFTDRKVTWMGFYGWWGVWCLIEIISLCLADETSLVDYKAGSNSSGHADTLQVIHVNDTGIKVNEAEAHNKSTLSPEETTCLLPKEPFTVLKEIIPTLSTSPAVLRLRRGFRKKTPGKCNKVLTQSSKLKKLGVEEENWTNGYAHERRSKVQHSIEKDEEKEDEDGHSEEEEKEIVSKTLRKVINRDKELEYNVGGYELPGVYHKQSLANETQTEDFMIANEELDESRARVKQSKVLLNKKVEDDVSVSKIRGKSSKRAHKKSRKFDKGYRHLKALYSQNNDYDDDTIRLMGRELRRVKVVEGDDPHLEVLSLRKRHPRRGRGTKGLGRTEPSPRIKREATETISKSKRFGSSTTEVSKQVQRSTEAVSTPASHTTRKNESANDDLRKAHIIKKSKEDKATQADVVSTMGPDAAEECENLPPHPMGCGPLNPQAVIPMPTGNKDKEYEDAMTGRLAEMVVDEVIKKLQKSPRMQKGLGLCCLTNVSDLSSRLSHPGTKEELEETSGETLKSCVLQEIINAIEKLTNSLGVGGNACIHPPQDMLDFLGWLLTENPSAPMPPAAYEGIPMKEIDFLFRYDDNSDSDKDEWREEDWGGEMYKDSGEEEEEKRGVSRVKDYLEDEWSEAPLRARRRSRQRKRTDREPGER